MAAALANAQREKEMDAKPVLHAVSFSFNKHELEWEQLFRVLLQPLSGQITLH